MDDIAKINQDRVAALDALSAKYDAMRNKLMADMSAINDKIIALHQAQNKESDELNAKFDRLYSEARAKGK